MEQTKQTPKALQDLLAKASTASGNQIMYLVQNTALRRFIQREVENILAKQLLSGEIKRGEKIIVDSDGNQLTFKT